MAAAPEVAPRTRGPASRFARDALPPGPSSPKIVQLYQWLYYPFETLAEMKRRYGTPFTLRFPNWPALVTYDDPDAIREIFTAPNDELLAGRANEPLRPVVGGRSLLLLDGEEHLRERKLLLPPFHGARMTRYGETMRDVTAATLRSWPVHEVSLVQPRMQSITLEVILRTVFGAEEGSSLDALRTALSTLIEDFSSPATLVPWFHVDLGPRSPWGRYIRTRARTHAMLHAHIEARRAASTSGDDILSMLLAARHEDGSPMSAEALRDELITLLVAGHETTATGLSWALHHLATHPEVQRRAHEELDRVMGAGPLDPERSSELSYLDAVVKETLRVLPVIAAVGRVVTAPRSFGGWTLPAGAMAVPSIFLTHRNPAVYDHPEEFDPARFLTRKYGPYELLPFGGGTRRCIGMAFALYEMRIVLATVLREHRVRPAPGYTLRHTRRSVTIAPSEDLPIVLERR